MHHKLILAGIGAVVLAFLTSCAARAQSSVASEEPELACSFRSPTTCWTVSGRFPAVRSKPAAAPPNQTPRHPSAVLASGSDSTTSLR